MSRSYEEALKTLETLIPSKGGRVDHAHVHNLDAMANYTQRLGLPLSALSVIHVAGTKGKGSTCAMSESVIRNLGFKTGLYTSPHLIDVRERIRIGGEPVDRERFLKYFWECWDQLASTGDGLKDMPTYFRFLTLLGFHTFIQEKVDVAILEVGIGGRLDATNIVPSPVACGITSLGFDHMNMLGSTLGEIAGEKAGIMKASCPAVTSPQPKEAMLSLRKHAKEVGIPLYQAPSFEDVCKLAGSKGLALSLGLPGKHQELNATLALSLSSLWLSSRSHTAPRLPPASADSTLPIPYPLDALVMNEDVVRGLNDARWPGRGQVLARRNTLFYLDGAHTQESIAWCNLWFSTEASKQENDLRVLVFYCTGDRDPQRLLRGFYETDEENFPKDLIRGPPRFDRVLVCPPDSSKTLLGSAAGSVTPAELERMKAMAESWQKLTSGGDVLDSTVSVQDSIGATLSEIQELAAANPDRKVRVLVTGSLYLVGDFLKRLEA